MSEQANANAGDNAQGTGAPEALTIDTVNKQINQAITGHLKRFGEQQSKAVAELVAAQLTQLTEQLKPAAKPEQSASASGENAEFNALRKQLDEQRRTTEALQKHLATEKQASRSLKLRQTLTEQLAAHGIEGPRAKGAMALLIDGEQRVGFDGDSDSIVFRDETGPLTLSEGLKSWVRTPDAKLYLPPAGGGGTGSTTGQSQQAGAAGLSVGQALLALARGEVSQF